MAFSTSGDNSILTSLISNTEMTIMCISGIFPVKSCCLCDRKWSADVKRCRSHHSLIYYCISEKYQWGGYYLETEMINHALKHLNAKEDATVFIENVGNLVYPAMFDLGEAIKVVTTSPTEGDDKLLKYPYMFQEAHICIINKVNLVPYLVQI